MAVLKIYDVNQPCLRAKCKKVSRITASEQKLLEDMIDTMRAAPGIGLAAPQVGVRLRLVVIELDEDHFSLVNPEIVESSDEIEIAEEGCLSLPSYYGPVERSTRVTVKALDNHGKRIKIKAEGMLARVLQHEIDHLDGILFFDPQRMRSLSDLRYAPPQEEGAENRDSGDSTSKRTTTTGTQISNRNDSITEPVGEPPAATVSMPRQQSSGTDLSQVI